MWTLKSKKCTIDIKTTLGTWYINKGHYDIIKNLTYRNDDITGKISFYKANQNRLPLKERHEL